MYVTCFVVPLTNNLFIWGCILKNFPDWDAAFLMLPDISSRPKRLQFPFTRSQSWMLKAFLQRHLNLSSKTANIRFNIHLTEAWWCKEEKFGLTSFMTDLCRLGLSYNEISSVENGTLANVPHLRELHLDNNALTVVPPGLSEHKYIQVRATGKPKKSKQPYELPTKHTTTGQDVYLHAFLLLGFV